MAPLSSENWPADVTTEAKARAACDECAQRELDRLLESASLRDSDQLKRFLRYIVERSLAGEGDQLKEYRLGVEVFDRDSSFDPKLDPVVRMAARRLRTKLEEYYDKEGRVDAVRIEVPKGGYAATIIEFPTEGDVRASAQPKAEQDSAELATAAAGHRTWKLIAGAILVIVALVAGGLYYRSHHVRRLTDQDTVVVADFANSTGDPVFDETLKTALVISLQQSPFLNVLPDSEVTKTLQLMTHPASTKLTADVTRELCQRAGSKAYFAGAIASLGSDYVLGLKAVNCQSGDTLAQEQVTVASKEKILDALGKVASRLRGQLGESLPSVRKFDVPLAAATTSSLEALKVFSLGQLVYRDAGPGAALYYYQKATELDPNFALGYYQAGSDYYVLGQVGRARQHLAKAYELRERASEREKLAITGSYYRYVTGELDKAVLAHQQAIEIYPNESLAYARLGVDFALQGQYDRAAAVSQQALRLEPEHIVPYVELADYALALQRFDEAKQIIRDAQARKLDNFILHNNLYALGFLSADAALMAEQQRWYSGTLHEDHGLALASDTEAYAGRLGNAQKLTKQGIDVAVRADSAETGALWQENAALREAAYGFPAEARQAAAAGLEHDPESQGVQVEAALALAMAGDTTRAESLARELDQRYPIDTQVQALWLPAIRARVALDGKNPALALKALPAASTIDMGLIQFADNLSCLYPVYVRGEAYLAAGQGAAAAAEFQKIIDHNGIVWNCWTGALAHLGVARANALQSRTSQGAEADAARVRALGAYKDFFTLWKDADPNIPVLKVARAEYAKLQ